MNGDDVVTPTFTDGDAGCDPDSARKEKFEPIWGDVF
jgi:hypothetical protein